MNPRFPTLLPAVLAAVLAAFLFATPAQAALRVVATVPDLGALAREVGGTDATVSVLAQPGQDPHFVDAKPSLALDLSRADLLLRVGLELETGWLPVLVTGSRNARIQEGAAGSLDCSTLVRVLDVPTGPVDRARGDVHPGGNPHYLYDPRNGLAVARGVTDRMASLDPGHAEGYRARLATLEARLAVSLRAWETRAAGLRGVPVVAYHRSLAYLVDWLGLQVLAELEPKPGIPPTPAHVATVLGRATQGGARMVVQEAYYPTSSSRPVAEKAGIPLVILPGGASTTQTYDQRVEDLVAALLAGLGG